MKIISHNLTGKIDERTVAILSYIDTTAGSLGIPFFIVGATARDILLESAHGIYPGRATMDIDIGAYVSGWDQFQALKEALAWTGKFSSTRQAQRLIYEGEVPLDIVPFGGIADVRDSITWPPGNDFEMSALYNLQRCHPFRPSCPVIKIC